MEPTTGIEPVNLILTKDALYQLSYVGLERETGFEPATHSLEGCCSSQLSYSRKIVPSFGFSQLQTRDPNLYALFGGGEGRIRTSEGFADRFTVCSLWPLGNLSIRPSLELAMGLEPATC